MNNINLHTGSVDKVADWLAHATFPGKEKNGKGRRHTMRIGVRFVLGRIADQPGITWQERWIAAGDENEAYYYDQLAYHRTGDPDLSRYVRLQLPQAFKALLRYGVIRPSLYLTLNPGIANSLLPGVLEEHQADIDRVAEAATDVAQMTKQGLTRLRLAAAAMIVYTGRPLGDINVTEWVSAERLRRQAEIDYKQWRTQAAAVRGNMPVPPQPFRAQPWSKMLRLAGAYAGARQAGLLQARPPEPGANPLPPTLDGAMRPAVNLTNILAAHGKDLPPRVRALIYDVYTIDGAAMDYSTLKHHIGDINTYFRAIHQVLPGHDSMNIPLNLREAVFNQLTRTNSTAAARPDQERLALGHMLSRVRIVYTMTNTVVMRAELTQHLDVLGTFPWSAATVRRISKKERARRKSKFHSKVNTQLPHLDRIVAAAHDLQQRTDRIRDAARQTLPGDTFTVDGVVYRRSKGTSDPQGDGVPPLSIRPEDGPAMGWFDIEHRAYQNAQACTLTVLLRESGLRIEEVAELEVENLATIASGDQAIPAMTVNPGKLDRERIVGLTPEALRALHALIIRTRERYGTSPLVQRADWHEGTDNPPARLIFHTVSRRIHIGPSREHFAGLLSRVTAHYDAHFQPEAPVGKISPHHMRRLFASDLGRRGVDILAIGEILGHAHTQSTDTYLHMSEAEALAVVIEARNRRNSITDGRGCTCCNGTGYHDTPDCGQTDDNDKNVE